MRLRIFLAFALVVLVSILSVVTLVRLTTQREVTTFMFRGGLSGSTELVNALEAYYKENQSWQGWKPSCVRPVPMAGWVKAPGNQAWAA
jgi:hypothetical protein